MRAKPSKFSLVQSDSIALPSPRRHNQSLNTAFMPQITNQKSCSQTKTDSPDARQRIYKSSDRFRSEMNDSIVSFGKQDNGVRSATSRKSYLKQEYMIKLINKHKSNVDQNKTSKYSFSVRHFLYKIKKASNYLRLEELSEPQNRMIKSLIDEKILKAQGGQLKSILELFPLFDKSSKWIQIVNIFQILTVISSNFWFPLELCFDINADEFEHSLSQILLLINLINILICINKSQIVKGQVISDKYKIFVNYVNQNLFEDFLQIFSLTFLIFCDNDYFENISLIVYTVFSTKKLIQMIEELNEQEQIQISFFNFPLLIRDLISLLNMLVTIIFIVHLIACAWHGVSTKLGEKGWVEVYGFNNLPVIEIYQISFYWAAMTMTTVGYGDITPKNMYEYIFANLIMLIACIVFGYTMNRIGILLSNIHLRNAEYKNNMSILNQYMSQQGIDVQLQGRIKSYLNYVQEAQNNNKEELVNNLVSKLPVSIQEDLNQQIKGQVIQKCKAFEKFSDSLKKRIYSIVETVQFVPNETVIDKQMQDDRSIYLIQQGQLQIYNIDTDSACGILNVGEYVGEISFFTDQPRTQRVISPGFSTCFKISRTKFIALLNDFIRDKELFHYLKDSLIYNNQYQKIQTQCLLCQSDGHLLNICPLSGFHPDLDKIIKKNAFPTIQMRSSMPLNQRHDKHYASIPKLQYTQQTVQKFQTDFFSDSLLSFDEKDYFRSPTTLSGDDIDSFQNADRVGQIQQSYNFENKDFDVLHQTIQKKNHHVSFDVKKTQELIQFDQRNSISEESQQENIKSSSKLSDQAFQRLATVEKVEYPLITPKRLIKQANRQISYKRFQTPASISSKLSKINQSNRSLVQLPQSDLSSKLIQTDELTLSIKKKGKQNHSALAPRFSSLNLEFQFEFNEKSQEYQNYFPNHNLSIIIKKLEFWRRGKSLKSNYTFNYQVMKKIQKIKRLLQA